MARTKRVARPDIQLDPVFRRQCWCMQLLLAGLRRHRDCLHVPGRVARPCRWCRNPRRGVILYFPQNGRTSEPFRDHRADAPGL